MSPWVQDAVITGHDRDQIGILVFPSAQGAALPRPELADHLAKALARLNAEEGGSSTRIARALVLPEPPSVDGGEITDKGYLNQRAVLTRRADAVVALYGNGNDVIYPAKAN